MELVYNSVSAHFVWP